MDRIRHRKPIIVPACRLFLSRFRPPLHIPYGRNCWPSRSCTMRPRCSKPLHVRPVQARSTQITGEMEGGHASAQIAMGGMYSTGGHVGGHVVGREDARDGFRNYQPKGNKRGILLSSTRRDARHIPDSGHDVLRPQLGGLESLPSWTKGTPVERGYAFPDSGLTVVLPREARTVRMRICLSNDGEVTVETLNSAGTSLSEVTAGSVNTCDDLEIAGSRISIVRFTGGSGEASIVRLTAVSGHPPAVFAGADRSVAAGSLVVLAGMAWDADGSIASYAWTQDNGSDDRRHDRGADRTVEGGGPARWPCSAPPTCRRT